MVFDRDLKDYYCENCESTLEELELNEFYDDRSIRERGKQKSSAKSGGKKVTSGKKKKKGVGRIKTDRDIKKEAKRTRKARDELEERDETDEEVEKQIPPLEAGTVKGVMFIMLGGIIDLISKLLPSICSILGVVGIFLLILGFFLIYQDRKRFSQDHQRNLKIALIILAIWIIVQIILFIYQFVITQKFIDQIAKFGDDDIIPMEIIAEYFDGVFIIISFSPLIIGLTAILKFLTIKELIQENLKLILTLVVILLIVSGFISMYSNIDNSEKFLDNMDDITKEEMISGEFNNSSELNLNEYLFYGSQFLSVTTEAIMILCFYWTYTYQKSKLQNKNY